MPSPEAILSLAATTANEYRMLAIGWHVYLGTILGALLSGWRPSNRLAGYAVVAPLFSVSALAWASGNPFNGATFAALALVLFGFTTRLSTEPVNVAPSFQLLAGVLLVAFGWIYPHFLTAGHWTAYMYAAPFGLLPCPTLSALIGFTLMLGLLRSNAWSMTLAIAGFGYGAMGVFTLGVRLDWGLLAGATLLGVVAGVSPRWRSERTDRDERTRREDAA